MRTSALLIFGFAAVAAPSLAAPVVFPQTENLFNGRGSICQRLPALCAPMVARDVDESAALGLRTKFQKFFPFWTRSHDSNNQLRDYLDFEARDYDDEEDSGAIVQLGPPLRTWTDSNGVVHYEANFLPPLNNGLGLPKQRRTYDAASALLARAAEDGESGALINNRLPGLRWVPNVFGAHHRRAFEDIVELLARAEYALR